MALADLNIFTNTESAAKTRLWAGTWPPACSYGAGTTGQRTFWPRGPAWPASVYWNVHLNTHTQFIDKNYIQYSHLISLWSLIPVSAYKLEEHSQQGLVKDGNHLGGSIGGSSKQIRMASKCGRMHPLGCGLNQGQGQGQCDHLSNTRSFRSSKK